MGVAIVKIVSCRPAWITTSNRFTHLFAEAVQGSGWRVHEFSWRPDSLFAPRVILLHWPDELFTAQGALANSKVWFKLNMLDVARKMFGVKLVWVVHETAPHDVGRKAKWSVRKFLGLLDGAIYLSHASKRAAEADIPLLTDIPALVTRHGDYRADMQAAPAPRRAPGERLNLVYFGQIRPYKNLDSLILAARGLSPEDVCIRVMGWSKDAAFTQSLVDLARKAPSVQLDIRDALVPQGEIEAALDESDGVVLPYRKILNSGAALFALSRNRPILAPRLGTLPELQQEVGKEWVSLYDEDVTEDSLRGFAARLRKPREATADLTQYEWAPIGEAIGGFFDQLARGEQQRSTLRDLKTESEPPWR